MKTYIKKCWHRGEVCEYFTLALFLNGERVKVHTSISESYIDNVAFRWMIS